MAACLPVCDGPGSAVDMTTLAIGAGALALLALAEGWVRRQRLADYIRYKPDELAGFTAAPNASGTMKRLYRWRFNAAGLRTDFDGPVGPEDVLLLGDSIVEGGSTTDQAETLGYQVAALTGRRVHPACAGGWSLENEFAYLRKYPELAAAKTIVFVTNSEDLCPLNPWSSASTHPTRAPRLHLAYLARRYSRPYRWRLRDWWAARFAGQPQVSGTVPESWAQSTERFFGTVDARVVWVLYPDRTETARHAPPCRALRPLIERRADIVEILEVGGWGKDCYLDQIHPNAKGRRLLAEAIADALQTAPANGTDTGG